jgi:hypothetical protein
MAMQSIEQLKARVEAQRHELLTDDRDPTRFFILDAGMRRQRRRFNLSDPGTPRVR